MTRKALARRIAGGVQDVVDQLAASPFVITQSEDLFELIDKDEQLMVLGLAVQSKLCGKVKAALFVLWTDDKRRQCRHVQR